MIGTLVNTAAILLGSGIGSTLKSKVNENCHQAVENAMGLVVLGLGINMLIENMPKSTHPVLPIIALPLGALIGSFFDLEDHLKGAFDRLGNNSLMEGVSTGVLLFCIGTLSILGPIRSALYGDNTFLYLNSALTMVTSIILASGYGIGICLCGLVLFIWQSIIYLLASNIGAFVTDDMLVEIAIVGSLLILSSAFSILKVKDFKTINLLPSLLIVIIFCLVSGAF